MKMMLLLLAGLLSCCGPTDGRSAQPAVYSQRSPRQDAVGEIKQSCVEKAQRGMCDFFVCFEERHPCESYNYALDYGWRFCSRFESNVFRLTDSGQRWVRGSRLCTMERLLNFYLEATIVCSDLAATMKDAQAACEVENGLCSGNMLRDNREVFTDVHNLGVRSVTQFMHAMKHCTISKARMVGSWFRDRLGEFSRLPAVQDLRNGLTLIHNDIVSQLKKIGRFLYTDDDDEEFNDADDWSSWDNENDGQRRRGGVEFDIE